MRNETKEVDFKHCCFNELSVLHDWSALCVRRRRFDENPVWKREPSKSWSLIPTNRRMEKTRNGNSAIWRRAMHKTFTFSIRRMNMCFIFMFDGASSAINVCLGVGCCFCCVIHHSCRNTFLGHATRHDQCEPPPQLSNEHH